MRGIWGASLLGLAALTATGCVREARIAMPSHVVAETERLELTGLGGWERGNFRLGATEGRFSRHALQRRADPVLVENVGGGRFEASGPELGAQLSGTCGFHESELDTGILTVAGQRLAYGCEFVRDGRPLEGGLLLAEAPRGRGLLAGRTRVGELQIGDTVIGIRAIHDMEGGALPTGTPLGYAFDVGRKQIGAIDLNGPNKTIYAPREPGAERDAVLIASLALSIFWDPGE
jgi:hypothetical protein